MGKAILVQDSHLKTHLDVYLNVTLYCTVCLLSVVAYGNEVSVLYLKKDICSVQLK